MELTDPFAKARRDDYRLVPSVAGGAAVAGTVGAAGMASREGINYLGNSLNGVKNPEARTALQRTGYHALRGARTGALVGAGLGGLLYYRRTGKKKTPSRQVAAKAWQTGSVRLQPTGYVAKAERARGQKIRRRVS